MCAQPPFEGFLAIGEIRETGSGKSTVFWQIEMAHRRLAEDGEALYVRFSWGRSAGSGIPSGGIIDEAAAINRWTLMSPNVRHPLLSDWTA